MTMTTDKVESVNKIEQNEEYNTILELLDYNMTIRHRRCSEEGGGGIRF